MSLLSKGKNLIVVLIFLVFLNLFLVFYYFSLPTPGSCFVLEEKYCKKGVPLYYNGKIAAVGFLLPKNTPIFSPFEGPINSSTVIFSKDKSYPALRISTGVRGNKVWEIERSFTAIFNQENIFFEEKNVKKGEIIGRVNEKPIDYYGSYNLIVYFSVPDKDQRLSFDKDFTLKLFGL